jgi:hypothetical protein
MKKLIQIFDYNGEDFPSIPANTQRTLSGTLRDDYAYCTGILLIGVGFEVECGLKIAGTQIFENKTNANLFNFNYYVGREESIYYFKESKIPARSSAFEFIVNNKSNVELPFSLYFILEND